MKKTFYFLRNLEPAYGGSVLLMMAVFFVFGAVLGSMAASGVLSSGSGRMYEMLTSYLLCYAGSYEHPSFFSALFVNFRYHALIFFISFIGYGVFFVPFVVMFRGFFLSFAVTGFVRAFGIGGIFLSFAAFGLQTVLSLPVLLVLSSRAFLFARARYDHHTTAGGRRVMGAMSPDRYLSMCGFFSVVLFVCVLIELLISPLLIGYIHNFL